MLNTLAYVALLWLIARFAVRDVRGVGDLLAINWAAQIVTWSVFQSVPPLAWLALEFIFAMACLLLVSTRLAVIVAVMSGFSIAVHAVSYATAQPLDTWVNVAAWAQMAAFIIGGWDNGLGRFIGPLVGDDRRGWGDRPDYIRGRHFVEKDEA